MLLFLAYMHKAEMLEELSAQTKRDTFVAEVSEELDKEIARINNIGLSSLIRWGK